MMKFSRITALSAVILIALVTIVGKGGGDGAPAGGGGGGGGGGQTADVAGTWTTNSTITADTCPLDPGDEQLGTLVITQSGADVTITADSGDTFTGTLNGDVLTFSGSFIDDGGEQVTLNGTVTFTGDSFSGTVDFSVDFNGDSCSGTLQVEGTRTSGGGGSGNPIALDSTNAEMVTSAVLESAANVQELPALLPFAVEIDKIQAGPASAAVIIAALVNSTLERAKLGALPVGITVDEDCDVDGITSTDTPVEGLTQVGDSVVTTFLDCDDGDGPLVGVVTMTVTEVDGSLTPPAFGLGLTMSFDGFGTAALPDPFSVDGESIVNISSPDGVELSIEISLTSLTYTVDGIPQLFNDYTAVVTINLNTLEFSFSALGVVDIPGLGTVSFETIGPFEFFAAGEVIISGDGSTIDCIATDNVTVILEIDTDGDGTPDEFIDTTWQALVGDGGAGT
jgi:hypothetical protein